jgi:hypothetical protein
MLCHVVWYKLTIVSGVFIVLIIWVDDLLIIMMMEAVSISETLANFYQTTWHDIPKDSHLHPCHCENLNLATNISINS